jgi:hypothetical protein
MSFGTGMILLKKYGKLATQHIFCLFLSLKEEKYVTKINDFDAFKKSKNRKKMCFVFSKLCWQVIIAINENKYNAYNIVRN